MQVYFNFFGTRGFQLLPLSSALVGMMFSSMLTRLAFRRSRGLAV